MMIMDSKMRKDSKKVEGESDRMYTPEEFWCFGVKADVPADPIDLPESNPAATPYQYSIILMVSTMVLFLELMSSFQTLMRCSTTTSTPAHTRATRPEI